VESGKMTKDLALIIHGKDLKQEHYLNTEDFLQALADNLQVKLRH
jgi:isocitrate dehydrogenase